MQKSSEDTYWQNRSKLSVYLRWLDGQQSSIQECLPRRTSLQSEGGSTEKIQTGGSSQKQPEKD